MIIAHTIIVHGNYNQVPTTVPLGISENAIYVHGILLSPVRHILSQALHSPEKP